MSNEKVDHLMHCAFTILKDDTNGQDVQTYDKECLQDAIHQAVGELQDYPCLTALYDNRGVDELTELAFEDPCHASTQLLLAVPGTLERKYLMEAHNHIARAVHLTGGNSESLPIAMARLAHELGIDDPDALQIELEILHRGESPSMS